MTDDRLITPGTSTTPGCRQGSCKLMSVRRERERGREEGVREMEREGKM